jgi:hypothetical protein
MTTLIFVMNCLQLLDLIVAFDILAGLQCIDRINNHLIGMVWCIF